MYCACPKCAALALDAFAAAAVEQRDREWRQDEARRAMQARAEERVTVNLEHLEAHRQVVEDCAKWEDAATALRAEVKRLRECAPWSCCPNCNPEGWDSFQRNRAALAAKEPSDE
jgi:hypothetical protein